MEEGSRQHSKLCHREGYAACSQHMQYVKCHVSHVSKLGEECGGGVGRQARKMIDYKNVRGKKKSGRCVAGKQCSTVMSVTKKTKCHAT